MLEATANNGPKTDPNMNSERPSWFARREIAPFTLEEPEVKKILEKPSKGYNRFHWNLRYEVTSPISFSSPSFYNPFSGKREGTLVEPGTYNISMEYLVNGELIKLYGPREFKVSLLENTCWL